MALLRWVLASSSCWVGPHAPSSSSSSCPPPPPRLVGLCCTRPPPLRCVRLGHTPPPPPLRVVFALHASSTLSSCWLGSYSSSSASSCHVGSDSSPFVVLGCCIVVIGFCSLSVGSTCRCQVEATGSWLVSIRPPSFRFPLLRFVGSRSPSFATICRHCPPLAFFSRTCRRCCCP